MAAPEKARVLYGEPMSRHTSWRVGGPADVYFKPRSREELVDFLRRLDADTPVHWVGLGSNLLVRDGGVRGVDHRHGRLPRAPAPSGRRAGRGRGGRPVHGAGAPLRALAGGPGRVLRRDSGHRRWRADDERGRIRRRDLEPCGRGGDGESPRAMSAPASGATTRSGTGEVRGPAGEWFLSARFQFDPAQPTSLEGVRSLIQERQAKQPLGHAELRLGVPQSARRLRRPSDRGRRPQGPPHRRRTGVRRSTPTSSSIPARPPPPTSRR